MPTVKVAVGYIIEQDVMNRLLADINIGDFEAEVAEAEAEADGAQVTTLNPVICKVITWRVGLTPEQQARIPEILCLFPLPSVTALLLIALSIPTFQGMFARTGTPSIPVPSSSVHAGSMSARTKKSTTGYATLNRTQPQDRGSWKYLVGASRKVI
ncbi:hypothetical protein EDD15DRAFT_2202349 [Pisolithus albus]|nr:hypothetical protein EDD15DRAFT_2202349 [Pisolithus albus]